MLHDSRVAPGLLRARHQGHVPRGVRGLRVQRARGRQLQRADGLSRRGPRRAAGEAQEHYLQERVAVAQQLPPAGPRVPLQHRVEGPAGLVLRSGTFIRAHLRRTQEGELVYRSSGVIRFKNCLFRLPYKKRKLPYHRSFTVPFLLHFTPALNLINGPEIQKHTSIEHENGIRQMLLGKAW